MAVNTYMVCLDDYEYYAKTHLSLMTWSFYSCGTDDEITLEENRRAFRRIRLKPRVLRDVSTRDLKTTILCREIDIPICISPTALHGWAHPDAEAGAARASEMFNTCMVLCTISSMSLEDICFANTGGTKWLNIYLFRNRHVTADLVLRAERSGCKGIVVSIDYCEPGNKRRLARVTGDIIAKNVDIPNFEKYYKECKQYLIRLY